MSEPRDPVRDARLWLSLYRGLGIDAVRIDDVVDGAGADAAARAGIEGAPPAGDSPEAALARLEEDELGECRRCGLCERRTNIVFGVGSARARLMFIGEGPGADEDAQGEPFVGRAGQLLDRIIAAMGLSRPEVYIANVVKCRPPGNRDPAPDEQATCLPFLRAQIGIIRPEVIVTLGRVPLMALLGERVPGITRVRGTWYSYEGIPMMPTFHPAYLLRNASAKRPVWEDMQAVMQRLGLPAPASED